MDIQMPVLNGIQASKQILRVQGDENITNIVALTSYTDDQTYSQIRQLNIKKIYTKPMKFTQLQKCI